MATFRASFLRDRIYNYGVATNNISSLDDSVIASARTLFLFGRNARVDQTSVNFTNSVIRTRDVTNVIFIGV